jgi:hypothetical protein
MDQRNSKYIVTGVDLPEDIKLTRPPGLDETETLVSWLDGGVVAGASQMVCLWYLKATPDQSYPAHSHDVDEIVGFFGSDPHNPRSLGGEIEFWLENERFILTESCLIFTPKGMRHGPLVIRKVDSPIFHLTTMIGGQYVMKDVAKD